MSNLTDENVVIAVFFVPAWSGARCSLWEQTDVLPANRNILLLIRIFDCLASSIVKLGTQQVLQLFPLINFILIAL